MKENRPELIKKVHRFLFITSLFVFKLTGAMRNDATMAGTSMLMDIRKQQPSEKIFSALDIRPDILGEIAGVGEQAGLIHVQAAKNHRNPSGCSCIFGRARHASLRYLAPGLIKTSWC